MAGGFGAKTNATQEPQLLGVQVTSCLYNTAIPVLYGKRRASGHVTWYGNFGPSGSSGKKGKSGKKGITNYQANLDCLLAFGPLWAIVNTYQNSTLYGYDYGSPVYAHVTTQTESVTSGSYTHNADGTYTYSNTVSAPGGNTLDFIYAISITPSTALSTTANEYGNPLAPVTITESSTEEWLYNTYENYASSGAGSVAWRPGSWEFGKPYCNSDHCSFPIGTDRGGDAWSITLNTAIAGTIKVYYGYHENNHSTPLSYIKYEFEPELGSGNEYASTPSQEIVYPDLSGVGGVGVDLGASATAPQLDVEPIGLYSLTKTGQVNPADIILDLILSGNIFFGEAPFWTPICWSHGLNFGGDPTRANFQGGPAGYPGTYTWPPTISFPYTLPTVDAVSGGDNATSGAGFQILRDPPAFSQGTYDHTKTYNVNSIVEFDGLFYKAITYGNNAPLNGNPFWSVFTEEFSDGLTDVRNYCAANGIYISLLLNSQKAASAVLAEICEVANCLPVWNGQTLDFYPLSEVTAVGGGYVYTPRTVNGPLASFDYRHFCTGENEAPVVVKQEGMQSVANILDINYADAGFTSNGMSNYQSYQSNNVRICDAEHCQLYGPMNGSPRGYDDYICDPNTATTVGWPILKRQRFADPYRIEFKLPATIASLLDPMDLITAVEPSLFGGTLPTGVVTTGPGAQDVRISSLEEDKDGTWTLSCERFMYGMSAPAAPSVSSSTPNPPPAQNSTAGSVNAPYFFEPTTALAQALGMQAANGLAIAVSCDSTNYGGCQVYVSTDGGSSYDLLGTLLGNSDMGVTMTADYPSHVNPDTSNTLHVNLSESDGTLMSFTSGQQTQLIPIALVDNAGTPSTGSAIGYTTSLPYEIIAYKTVTLTGTNEYSLSPTILRGQLGTVPADHPLGSIVGSVFVDLSNVNSVFKTIIPSGSILGSTLYFKFATFNQYGSGLQDLSDCTAYTFTLTGQTNPGGTVGPAGQYTITPNPCLYQGKSGGWPGVDSGSSGWTNPDYVYFPAVTVNYSSGAVTYPANDAGTSAFTGSGQTVYVTIYDPAKAGGSQPIHADSTNANATTPGYAYLGQITSAASGSSGNAGGSSGSGGPTNTSTEVAITVDGVLWV